MPDDTGKLTSADIPIISNFIRSASLDNCLTCPVTGIRVKIGKWNISDRLCMVPVMGVGLGVSKQYVAMLHMVSPAGGTVLLDALAIGILDIEMVH